MKDSEGLVLSSYSAVLSFFWCLSCQNEDSPLWNRWAFLLWSAFNLEWFFPPLCLNITTGPHFALPETNHWEFQAGGRWTTSGKIWPWTNNFQEHEFFPSASLNITHDFPPLNTRIQNSYFRTEQWSIQCILIIPNTGQHQMLQEGI